MRYLSFPAGFALLAVLALGVAPSFAEQQPETVALSGSQEIEHPLVPVIRRLTDVRSRIEREVHDYTATLIKRERVDGKLTEHNYIYTKIRHEPFSVYLYFLAPQDLKGREVLYVHGQNDGNIVVHEGSGLTARIGMISLRPDGRLAMRDQKYPITDIGILNLTRRWLEVAQLETQFGECDVAILEGAKINGRSSTCIQVTHSVPRKEFYANVARLYIDDELGLPIRHEAYDWPRQPGGRPELTEEYTYLNMKLNNNLADVDFDHRNHDYNFVRKGNRRGN